MSTNPCANELLLRGIDGANPLGFLAALGTLRTASAAWTAGGSPGVAWRSRVTPADRSPDSRSGRDDRAPTGPRASSPPAVAQIRLSWRIADGAWRPVLHGFPSQSPEQVISALEAQLAKMKGYSAFQLGDDLKVSRADFRSYAQRSVEAAHGHGDRTWADFAAAFGSDAFEEKGAKGDTEKAIQDTALRTMSGAGHQHFLKTMRTLIEDTEAEHLRRALLEPWDYGDALQNHSLRWDPADEQRYALQWSDPSGDPERRRRGAMWGANRLAIEGLPLLPTVPDSRGLATTGFRGSSSRDTCWTWPIWTAPLSEDAVRSLLAFEALQEAAPDRSLLVEMGVSEVYRCRRITEGKYRSFTPARAV